MNDKYTDVLVSNNKLYLAKDPDEKYTLTNQKLKSFIEKITSSIPGSLGLIEIDLPYSLNSFTNENIFYEKYLAGGMDILISSRENMRLADGLKQGLYIQTKDYGTFSRFVTSDAVIVKRLIIDSGSNMKIISDCFDLVCESRFTKNKKIVFTSDVATTILHSSPEEYHGVIEVLNKAKDKYKSPYSGNLMMR